jgi:hypothetical protein
MAASSPASASRGSGGDPQVLRNRGLELVAGMGMRRAAPASVLHQEPERFEIHHNLSLIPRKTARTSSQMSVYIA